MALGPRDDFDPDWYFEHVLADAEPGGPRHVPWGPAREWQRWWRAQVGSESMLQIAAQQGFVLALADLSAFGVGPSTARTAVRHGRWTAPGRGAISPLDIRDNDSHLEARRAHALTCAASALRRPDHVVSARSAAILHGLPTLAVPSQPELTAVGDATLGRARRAHVFGAAISARSIADWFGIPITTVERTVVDLARHDRRDGLVAADAALRERLVGTFDAELALATGWPGVVAARDVLALANPDAESPLESLTRLGLHDSGFPPPRLQYRIDRYRVDFCWPEYRFVLEADGRSKYVADANWQERQRERALRRAGYRVERVTWHEVVFDWPATAEHLRRGLS